MWLICRLEFNGRRQEVMRPGRYTQLFFLDEAVALAAGHRPCGECRRTHYRAYLDAVNDSDRDAISGAAQLDKKLNAERRAARPSSTIGSLPDGTFVTLGNNDFRLVCRGALHTWSADGYVDRVAVADYQGVEATVLTPPTSVEALRRGYPVAVHPSVDAPIPERTVPQPGVLTAELRSEMERILRASSPGLTHGEVFRYVEQWLDAEQISRRHGTGLDNVRVFMRSLEHLFDGTLPRSQSAAKTNSQVYKEFLNHRLSPELRDYVNERLQQLMSINPKITSEPLRTRNYQYSATRSGQVAAESECTRCHLVHAGDCN